MNVLLIKTSSLGDVIHTLPALTDAWRASGGAISFDWVVEEGLAEIPGWHPAVNRVIPVALRRWRKTPLKTLRTGEFGAFVAALRQSPYDCVIDAQGLLKSAWLTRFVSAPVYGYDTDSIREPLASRFYQHRLAVSRRLHAVERIRRLFELALGYSLGDGAGIAPPDYGLWLEAAALCEEPYVFLLHGTTWDTKHYPESGWIRISRLLQEHGLVPVVTWGNEVEAQRAARLTASGARLLPRGSLRQLAGYLRGAAGAISVDTGLGHLATALDVPLVGLYGPTDPALSGIYGARQISLRADYHCAPCLRRSCRFACLGTAASYRFPDTDMPALARLPSPETSPAAERAAFASPCWSALPPELIVDSLLATLAAGAPAGKGV